LILKSCDEIDKDLDEKLKEIMKVVMVSQIWYMITMTKMMQDIF
jgi:hypothetical protein